MVQKELINELAFRTGTTKKLSRQMLEALLDIIVETVASGDIVKIVGFGIFTMAKKSARNYVNVNTGKQCRLSTRLVPEFIPGIRLTGLSKEVSKDESHSS